MKTRHTGISAHVLRIALLGAALAVAPPVPAAPPAGKPGAPGDLVRVVKYEESAGSRILYHDAAGGISLPTARPVRGSARDRRPPIDAAGRIGASAPRPPAKAGRSQRKGRGGGS